MIEVEVLHLEIGLLLTMHKLNLLLLLVLQRVRVNLGCKEMSVKGCIG